MNKKELTEMLNKKEYAFTECAYCKQKIYRGVYVESGLGKKVLFPKLLTQHFTNNTVEIPIHYLCLNDMMKDLIEQGGNELDVRDTKILIRS